jgi:hypothetical protein
MTRKTVAAVAFGKEGTLHLPDRPRWRAMPPQRTGIPAAVSGQQINKQTTGVVSPVQQAT